jgi:hypothetical protein
MILGRFPFIGQVGLEDIQGKYFKISEANFKMLHLKFR